MKVVLDTDTLIYFLKGQNNIVKHIANISADGLHTTIVNKTKLLFGAFNSINKTNNLQVIKQLFNNIQTLPFCNDACEFFAEQKALLKRKGTPLADMDLMIASICVVNQMILITNNEKHFKRLASLKIENWSKDN